MKPKLRMPAPKGVGSIQEIDAPGNVVVFGANGAGKSKLGVWIELRSQTSAHVHRIGAQRALSVPDFATVRNLQESINDLLWGSPDSKYSNLTYKSGHRWQYRPETSLLDDYSKVLSALFASDAKRNKDYVDLVRSSNGNPIVPDSPSDILQQVWLDILPHRRLKLIDGQVLAFDQSGSEYKGGSMSDGERVALYLLGQCLLSPSESIVIVDEPELHLHRALMSRLWSAIEKLRPDVLFIYITHDLDFASSRSEARKIWVRSYSAGDVWDWGLTESLPGIPEPVLLEVLGSRKKVLFVEGERGSLDAAVLQEVYRDYHVIPRGGCESVIRSTKAFREPIDSTRIEVVGVVDRDVRSEKEIESLRSHSIAVLPVAEIENLICSEEVVRLVAELLHLDIEQKVEAVKRSVLSWFEEELDTQIHLRVSTEVKFRLSQFVAQKDGEPMATQLSEYICKIVDDPIAGIISRDMADIIKTKDFSKCLAVYNRKSLPRRIAPILDLQPGAYERFVLSTLGGSSRGRMLEVLRRMCPVLSPSDAH